MTADERTERLEQRVDRLEDQYRDDVAAIHTKIDTLVKAINAHLVDSAKANCPSPGSCIVLSGELKNTIAMQTAILNRVELAELRILVIEKWQWKMMGALALLLTFLTLFAPSIRQLFRLE